MKHLTDQQLIEKVNELAREFASIRGFEAQDGLLFYKSKHPRMVECWQMAARSCEFWTHSEIHDALLCVDEKSA